MNRAELEEFWDIIEAWHESDKSQNIQYFDPHENDWIRTMNVPFSFGVKLRLEPIDLTLV